MKMEVKKGVTPVVATALLLSIAVGSVVTAGVFMDDTLQDLRKAFGDEVDDETGNPDISIISAVEDSSDNIDLVLRNSGNGPVDLDSGDGLVILAGDSGMLQGSGSDWRYPDGNPGILSPGDTVEIEIMNPGFPSSGPVEVDINGPQEISAGVVCYPSGC